MPIDSLQRALGTPMELEVNGKKYQLSPLPLGKLAELDSWARREPFRELREKLLALGDIGVSEAAKTALIMEAQKASDDPVQIALHLTSVPGIVKTVGLSLKVKHPGLKDAELDEIIKGIGLKEIEAMVAALSGPESDSKK